MASGFSHSHHSVPRPVCQNLVRAMAPLCSTPTRPFRLPTTPPACHDVTDFIFYGDYTEEFVQRGTFEDPLLLASSKGITAAEAEQDSLAGEPLMDLSEIWSQTGDSHSSPCRDASPPLPSSDTPSDGSPMHSSASSTPRTGSSWSPGAVPRAPRRATLRREPRGVTSRRRLFASPPSSAAAEE